MTIGAYVTSTMGMNAQTHSLQQISMNVANVSTTGYKKVDARFETFMSVYSDSGANNTYFTANNVDRRLVNIAGQQTKTGSIYDLAITGEGFFTVEGAAGTMFSRAGDFKATAIPLDGYPERTISFERVASDGNRETVTKPASYLMNASNYYVMGWNYNPESETFESNLEPVIISPQEYYAGHVTTKMSLIGNIPSDATETQKLKFGVYDTSYHQHSLISYWEPIENMPNGWNLSFSLDNGASVTSDSVTVQFDQDGNIISPIDPINVSVDWGNGSAGSIAVDLSHMSQFASYLQGSVFSQDGNSLGNLVGTSWNEKGILVAKYSNGASEPVCKVAVAKVTSPNLMEAVSGNMFALTTEAGTLEIVDLENTKTETQIAGETLENSNVALEEEFSNMVITQRAYSSNVNAFTTANEMIQEAISILT